MGAPTADPPAPIFGREAETAALTEAIRSVAHGRSRLLRIEGEAGVGKTSLVELCLRSVRDVEVLRTDAGEPEADIPFSGMHGLLRPLAHRLPDLAGPQRAALAPALALGGVGDALPFALGVAILNLLALASDAGPMVVVVDDAQWLDPVSAGALQFAARRLYAEPIAFLVVLRSGQGPGLDPTPFEVTTLGPIDPVPGRFPPGHRAERLPVPAAVADEIVAASGGNPLAVIEVVDQLDAAVLTGEEPLPDPLPMAGQAGSSYARRFAELPEAARRALTVVAASDRTERASLERARPCRPRHRSPPRPPKRQTWSASRVTSCHFGRPLGRSAVYHSAPSPDRRRAHRAIAEAAIETGDLYREAWHRAKATAGTDSDVASTLERRAEEVAHLGGPQAAASALHTAAELTPPGEERARRLVAEAMAQLMAGHPDVAASALVEALGSSSDTGLRAEAMHLQGRLLTLTGATVDGVDVLRAASALVESTDPGAGGGDPDRRHAPVQHGPPPPARPRDRPSRL